MALDTIKIPPPVYGEPALARVTATASTPLTLGFRLSFGADSASAPSVTETLVQQYGGYCEALFRQLASDAPMELISLVRLGGLRPGKLTHAAEALGATGRPEAANLLIELLSTHPSALVREGAIFGILVGSFDVARPALEHLAEADPSAAVREAARSALDLL